MDSRKLDQLLAAKNGDKAAAEEFIGGNTALVWSIVRRFYGRGAEPDDLYQIGCIGLIKAVNNFDPSYNVEFSTYAVPMIIGEIKRFLRDDGMIKVSRKLRDIATKANAAINNYQIQNGREPAISDLSSALDIPGEEIVMALEATSRHESIYSQIGGDQGQSSTLLLDKIVQDTDQEETIVCNTDLVNAMKKLDQRSQTLLKMRFFMNKTQSETAARLGVSQVQISRMEKRLLLQLRKLLE